MLNVLCVSFEALYVNIPAAPAEFALLQARKVACIEYRFCVILLTLI